MRPAEEDLKGRRILVTGATGYIASRLIPRLLDASTDVRATSRSPHALAARFSGLETIASDFMDQRSLEDALQGIEIAYYLVHSMDMRDFEERDRVAARNFLAAAERAKVERIVYLSGLGRADDRLSSHLFSRHEVGEILASGSIPVTELRAAIVIGSGSSAFDMLRYLTERLPVMIAPRWLATRIQPIAEDDLVSYLIAAGSEPHPGGIVEIGGSDVVTYREMIHGYARLRRLRRFVMSVPLLTPRLSSYWVRLITPVPTSISRPLIDGLQNEVVVTDDVAASRYPSIAPMGYVEGAVAALDRQEELLGEELSSGLSIPGSRLAVLTDERRVDLDVSIDGIAAVLADFGGDASWYPLPWAWAVRKWMDKLFRGGDLSWTRPEGPIIRGSLVDWWKVDVVEPDALVLRSLMKTPGEAWLAFRGGRRDSGATLVQSAVFRPRGILGRLYWWGLWPFHHPIFGAMVRRLAKRVTALSGPS
ncbi:MAG: SDR family oxidoreductase [Actinobacteria bacterium]|nr:SDR family oxidoreductase [Actinomycetota bacterium]